MSHGVQNRSVVMGHTNWWRGWKCVTPKSMDINSTAGGQMMAGVGRV